MRLPRRLAGVAAATALALGVGTAIAPSAGAAASAAPATGTRSLAAVLTSDGNRFDRNWYDFDVVTEAVLAVLAAKPDSPVKVLTQGDVPLTAFIPNDRAFQVLDYDLTGHWRHSERAVFSDIAGLGIPTLETVLLYHVVPGATITARQALRSDGAVLTTAQGGTITVDVISRFFGIVILRDQDPNDINPFLVPSRLDINKGNAQIAHGIGFVLRPADL